MVPMPRIITIPVEGPRGRPMRRSALTTGTASAAKSSEIASGSVMTAK